MPRLQSALQHCLMPARWRSDLSTLREASHNLDHQQLQGQRLEGRGIKERYQNVFVRFLTVSTPCDEASETEVDIGIGLQEWDQLAEGVARKQFSHFGHVLNTLP